MEIHDTNIRSQNGRLHRGLPSPMQLNVLDKVSISPALNTVAFLPLLRSLFSSNYNLQKYLHQLPHHFTAFRYLV